MMFFDLNSKTRNLFFRAAVRVALPWAIVVFLFFYLITAASTYAFDIGFSEADILLNAAVSSVVVFSIYVTYQIYNLNKSMRKVLNGEKTMAELLGQEGEER